MGCDLEQGSEQVVAGRVVVMAVTKILHGAGPVNAGHKTVIAQAGALDYGGGTEEQNFIERSLRTELVDAMQHERAGSQRCD